MEIEKMNDIKVIVFQLEKEEYAVSVQQVGSIERIQPITRVPQTETFVKGVINLRGVITPVIDIRLRFGLEEKEYTESSRIIIVHLDDMEVGLIVDSANDVIDIAKNAIEPAPEIIGTVDTDYIEGVAKVEDRLLILLNLQKVLTPEEINDLSTAEG
ncbi:chemotaxis protein CheW [Virgibacillus sp. YIM 98842]|uniref:chemotaxis protein CheW n=1 Tax=Virgibacillus sp. YIM 98842 TaxID=2663533 RepID=UPI001969E34C|nr:chemotaxis protein CheW [Virgibacillus sp. YIM 98842]